MATVARRRAAHEQIVSRQSTVEFISSLLGGTDTPDAPLEQKFEGLPSTAAEMTALAESTPLAAAAKIKSGAGDAAHVAAGDVASGPYAQERAFLSLETSDVMNTLGSGALCTRRRDRAASYFSDAGAPTFRDTS